jgi:hypothetical protein
MTKLLPIAALFIAAGAIAAPVLMSDPAESGSEQIAAATTNDLTRRGTRAPLTDLADASWEGCGEPTDQNVKSTDQPRRGSRSEFILASNDMASLDLDGPRRGTR